MNYKHCQPCTNFGRCLSCEQPMCNTCKESYDSPHMVLTEESHDELDKLIEEQDLWADNFCLECLFYMHHDINNPEQENYDDDIIFKVEEYQNGTEMRNYGSLFCNLRMESPKWETRVIILGTKPTPPPAIRGPFIIHPEGTTEEDITND